MGAPLGNRNATKALQFANALNRAIAQDDGKRLRQAAETLLTKAADGEPWALQMLADRLDGKPGQRVEVDVTNRQIHEYSDEELAAVAFGSGAGTLAAQISAGEPSGMH